MDERVTSKDITTFSKSSDREIVGTRMYDAPRDLVFQMWTDPNHIGHWWGPNGFSLTIHEMDVRPGGVWRFIMHGPDGADYPNKIVYLEVKKPERLVYDHGKEGKPDYFQVTATFEDLGEKTRLSMRALVKTAAKREEEVKKHGAVEGMIQTLGRLEKYLTKF